MTETPSPAEAWRVAEPVHILIAGGHGQVGQALAHATWPDGVVLHRPTRAALDLTDATALVQAFAETPYVAVINAAGFTAVDAAESRVGDAFLANALIPARLAESARRADVPLIHLSTDCVFDGQLGRPYAEADTSAPISVYGASKRAGELAVLSAHPRAAVVRTAWVVSARGKNFVRTILEAAASRAELTVIADVVGSPTSADDLAQALVTLTMAMVADRGAPTGVYHCVNAGEASWADVAEEAVRLAGLPTAIRRIPAEARPAPAPRPANSRLSCEKLARDHGVTMRDWRAALVKIVAELKPEGVAS